MTKIRNQSIVKQVLARDLGLCRCCGFEASEVHHIVPIIYGGEDNPKNMISLCWTCHRDAPNTKEEFYNYMKSGGARTLLGYGKIVELSQKAELESNGNLKFQDMFSLGRKIMLYFKTCSAEWALEKYNLLDYDKIEDVNFSENYIKSAETIKTPTKLTKENTAESLSSAHNQSFMQTFKYPLSLKNNMVITNYGI